MNDAGTVKTVCMDADEIERSLTRIAHQILETNKGAGNIALVGIVTRGDLLAKRLAEKIEAIEGTKVPLGKLDISFYRDDFATHLSPEVHSTDILFDLDGKDVVLVDDVLYTGRTIRLPPTRTCACSWKRRTASPRSRYWKSLRAPARVRHRWEVNRAWPSITSI